MAVVQGAQTSLSFWPSLKEAMYEPFQDRYIQQNESAIPTSGLDMTPTSWTNSLRQILVAGGILAIPFLCNYLFTLSMYHWANMRRKQGQTPPEYPAMPIIGSTFSFLWDSASFVTKATKYAGKLTSVRISLLINGIYLVSEPKAIADMWKNPNLSSPIYVYTVGLRYIFGMHERGIEAYTADDSGPYRKPHPFSKVEPHDRIDFLTHDSLLRGLTSNSMLPTFERFQTILKRNLDAEDIGDEWIEQPDLFALFRNTVGKAVLESLFGPSLLAINPNFIQDLWEFDEQVVNLAKRFPRFLIPSAFRVRERLLAQIQNWYNYARQHFRDTSAQDTQWDPYWGSVMNRERQSMLLSISGQDDAAVASTDLGLIWTSVTNVVPSTMLTAFHIFSDADLLSRIRTSISDSVSHNPSSGFDASMDKLLQKDLLQSVYAETLRLYVQSYITRCSAHECATVGDWTLPRNEVSMVSSYVAHMNTSLWNEQDGRHPVTSFWADRFMLDPADPSSGPMDPATPEARDIRAKLATKEKHFSAKGLAGAWIPYGGGFSACPGRLLAKRIILYTCALLVSEFDVEVKDKGFEMDSSSFGLGTQKPKTKIGFRIRRKRGE
ncbi:hypothetical protein COCC4DRAFT_209279 [Bipolaris maydis ATCC 48331]|uniref:Cytochrome P450 n=2 Tax=Cochliobolus heterostrophus TaxID=5016 RepID=M2VAB8_COCH5|nr:uncharacterized protein COCC4DRAFT_209279 [Bipolaris maydis ATCC 48331]EMD96663.1 hypothetical protein COCHEDRAFT_1162585 [Bipolaris maydis C5]KAH7558360.1 hypothetical protein BM1_05632 [Bipolaris maydis]ENH98771.1 hypothetical protein COCC4DRAFT_209279 [Bipolaris maydis ATCC 48331]KAJ5031455.1 cytochrome P450 [Bipolaris maydis]KAJ5060504.1 cytochrome P450 [Bipolaris maydis]